MSTQKKIGHIIAALMLLAALMLPTTVQFFHIVDGESHEQVECKDQSTHIHQGVPDCQVCQFHLASFNYDLARYSDFTPTIVPSRVENQFRVLRLHSFKVTNTQLRAPPQFLS
ncbi:hypothetical protein ACEZ3G_03185 [Maribacter algicola]|uniref:Uncharacterized protein n=1 Tax=Meishania litoralis TaxID=3434685 RepID=A0ACC7LFS4_9FLAO